MSDWTLRIEHADGSQSELSIVKPDAVGDNNAPSLQTLSIDRTLAREPDQADRAECQVYRDAWRDIEPDIDAIDDTFVISENGTDVFGGRLKDAQHDGITVSVILDGPKRDALDAEPSGGNDVYEPQPDDEILTDILSRVPTVDAGTVEQNKVVGFSESQAAPAKSITKLAEAAGAETLYQPGFELDYVDRLGDDRTDETLSASEGTLVGEPRIQVDETEAVTHIRVLGSQEGTAQIVAESVVDDTPERSVWRQHTDKDIQQQSRAEAVAAELAEEYQDAPTHLDIEVPVAAAVEPSLGDEFTVELPTHNISEELRIIELERIIDEGGDRFRALLSNRKHARGIGGDDDRRSLDEFREGNAGQYFFDSDSQGWDETGPDEPYEFTYWLPPDTIDSFRGVLRLESRPFRLKASQEGHTHSFDWVHDHDVSFETATTTGENTDEGLLQQQSSGTAVQSNVGTDWVDLISFDVTEPGAEVRLLATMRVLNIEGGSAWEVRLRNENTDETTVAHRLFPFEEVVTYKYAFHQDLEGETVVLEARRRDTDADPEFTVFTLATMAVIGRHTHDVSVSDSTTSAAGGNSDDTTTSEAAVDPGINTIADETADSVSVSVDGTTVASGLDHPISESIDIETALDSGDNTITITSESLCELRATVEFEGLKNATTDQQ